MKKRTQTRKARTRTTRKIEGKITRKTQQEQQTRHKTEQEDKGQSQSLHYKTKQHKINIKTKTRKQVEKHIKLEEKPTNTQYKENP